MALNANALTLLATAKDHLDIPVAELGEDSKVERLINTASTFIENFCKRKLATATYTEYVDGRSANRILLKEWPVLGGLADGGTKPEVWIDGDSVFGSGTEVDPDTYFVVNNIELVRVGSYGGLWPKGYRNIKVTYDAGYGTAVSGDLPNDLEQACLDYVLWLYDMGSDRRVGRNTKTKGDESVSFESRLPQHIELILEPYVRTEFPSGLPVGVRNR